MSAFELYLTLHIFAAVIWVGGGFTLQLAYRLAFQSADPGPRVFLGNAAEWIGQRFYLGSSIALLVTGFLMISEADISVGDGWILFGLAVIVASAAVGAGYLGPESGRLGKLMEAKGPDDPEVIDRVKRLLLISRIELVFLFLVLADMVAKPGA